jgi:predicted permease
MNILWQDLRYGARMLMKQKGVTAIAALSLAIGIGANTALFSVMDAMLLKMLPVREPERLVLFRAVAPPGFSPGSYSGGNSYTDPATGQLILRVFPHQVYQRMRERQSVLSDVFVFSNLALYAGLDGRTEAASGQVVSGNYFTGLGVQAMLGRTLTDEDDKPAARPVAVLSYRYWRQRLGGDKSAVGKQINLNNVAFTIVGVTPPGFEGAMNIGTTQDVTVSVVWEPQLIRERNRSRMSGPGEWWLRLMGRLKPGATAEQARAQLENAFHQAVLEHRAARQASDGNVIGDLVPKDYPRLYLDPGGQGEMYTRQSYAPSLYLLQGVVGLVLLIACANVANLLLARSAARQKEVALRLALGASRWRLIRWLLTESVLLAVLGGALGIVFALWFKNGLLAVSDWGGRGMRALEPQLDWRALAFMLGLSLLTGILFGLAPAWRSSKVDLTPALKDNRRSSSAVSRSLIGRGLVASQVALSLLLSAGAWMFAHTLINLQRVEPGFNTRNLLLFSVQQGMMGYKEERLAQFYERLSTRLEAVPGAQAVTFSSLSLLSGSWSKRDIYLRGDVATVPDSEGRIRPSDSVYINQARENFLEVMQIPLLAGRGLRASDDTRSPRVAVVNQTFARRHFPNENPVGKRFAFDPRKPDEVEIIGLAKDAKYTRQRDEVPPTAYLSWRQELRGMGMGATYEVRMAGDPTAIIAAVRRAAHEVDASLPLNNIKTQEEQADETLRMERLFAKLTTLFAALAQLLASIGLFGALAYSVAQRTREIGIRMALGADRRDVLKMILRQGMALALLGVALGSAVAYTLTKYLESRINLKDMLYGVQVNDPLAYGAIAGLLLLVALAACFIPARRATTVDPTVALRGE